MNPKPRPHLPLANAALTFSLLLLSVAGCSRQPATPSAAVPPVAMPPPADAVARVGDEWITAEQFQRAAARRGVGSDPQARRALLGELIRFRARVQEAKARGLDRDPEIISALESLLAERVRTADAEKLGATLAVTPAEIAADYAAHPERYRLPAKVRAAWVFTEAPASFTAEKRAERRATAELARQRALTLTDSANGFGPVAAEFSFDGTTRHRGGDLGYFLEGQPPEGVDPAVADAAFALTTPGQISELLETPRGFCLVRLTERQAGGMRPLEKVRHEIAARLTREKTRQMEAALAASALHGRASEVFEDRLATVPVLAPPQVAEEEATPPPVPGS